MHKTEKKILQGLFRKFHQLLKICHFQEAHCTKIKLTLKTKYILINSDSFSSALALFLIK